jgi:hypothetical protein
MAVDERSRHQLHVKLEQILGSEDAGTLMAHLPPVGWADVATKRDLDQLAAGFKREHEQMALTWKLELDATKSDLLATFRHELHAEVRSLMVFVSTLMVALGGIAFAAARLT